MISNMSGETLMLFLVIMLALVVVLIVFLRWFSYRERMARINQGQGTSISNDPEQQAKRALSSSLTTTLIGVAITIGLLTLGIGPWLLAGLIPIFIGLSMILTYVITAADNPNTKKDGKLVGTSEAAPTKEMQKKDSQLTTEKNN